MNGTGAMMLNSLSTRRGFTPLNRLESLRLHILGGASHNVTARSRPEPDSKPGQILRAQHWTLHSVRLTGTHDLGLLSPLPQRCAAPAAWRRG